MDEVERALEPTIENNKITDVVVATFNSLLRKHGLAMSPAYNIVQKALSVINKIEVVDQVLPSSPIDVNAWLEVLKDTHPDDPFNKNYYGRIEKFFAKMTTKFNAKILRIIYSQLQPDDTTLNQEIENIGRFLTILNGPPVRPLSGPVIIPVSVDFPSDMPMDELVRNVHQALPARSWSREAVFSCIKAYGVSISPIKVCPKCNDEEYMSVKVCECVEPSIELLAHIIFSLADQMEWYSNGELWSPLINRTQLMAALELALILHTKYGWVYPKYVAQVSLKNEYPIDVLIRPWSEDVICIWNLENITLKDNKCPEVRYNMKTRAVDISTTYKLTHYLWD